MINLKIVPEDQFQNIKLFADRIDQYKIKYPVLDHLFLDISGKKFSRWIMMVMHWEENYNNLEILKLKLWFEKNDIGVLAYGNINQLPIFGFLSDQVLLQVKSNLNSIYSNAFSSYVNRNTHYKAYLKTEDAEEIVETRRAVGSWPSRWHPYLRQAWQEISDEEVVARFKNVDMYVRESTYELYCRLVDQDIIRKNVIMREVKNCHTDKNPELRQSMENATQLLKIMNSQIARLKLPMSLELDWRLKPQELLRKIADYHYMGVQTLASILSNWMWICYYGSSNLFAFFPFKVLNLSDGFHTPPLQKISRDLAVARFGKLGEIFPVVGHFYNGRVYQNQGDLFCNFDKYIDAIHEFSEYTLSYNMSCFRSKFAQPKLVEKLFNIQ